MKKETLLLRTIALLMGAGIFIYTIHRFGGVGPVLSNLLRIKYFYLLLILNSFVWIAFNTEAWKKLFDSLNEKISFLPLLKIKLSGEAINFMTPLGFMAGDPIRVLLLKRFVGPEARLRSVVIDRSLHSLTAQVFCLTGVLFIFTQDIAFPLWLTMIIVTIYLVMSTVLFSIIYCMVTGRGFGMIERVIHFLKIEKRFPKIHHHLNELREHLGYYQNHPRKAFFLAFLWHLAGRILGACEIMIILYCLSGQWHFVFSFILISFSSFFSVTFGFIPGALGVAEVLYAQFAILYGYQPETGLTIQIVRRFRVLFWILIGTLVIDYHEIAHFFKKGGKKEGLPLDHKKFDKGLNNQ